MNPRRSPQGVDWFGSVWSSVRGSQRSGARDQLVFLGTGPSGKPSYQCRAWRSVVNSTTVRHFQPWFFYWLTARKHLWLGKHYRFHKAIARRQWWRFKNVISDYDKISLKLWKTQNFRGIVRALENWHMSEARSTSPETTGHILQLYYLYIERPIQVYLCL